MARPFSGPLLTSNCRCGVDAAGPLGYSKVLVVQVLRRAVQYGRGAFWSIAVLKFTVFTVCFITVTEYLVRVARDGSDATQSEVKQRKLEASVRHERNQESAEAGVNMDGNLVLETELRNLRNVVHRSGGEVRSGSDNLKEKLLTRHTQTGKYHARVFRNGFAECSEIHSEIFVHWNVSNANTHKMGCLKSAHVFSAELAHTLSNAA